MSELKPVRIPRALRVIPAPELHQVYCGVCRGERLAWEQLTREQQDGWAAVADAVRDQLETVAGMRKKESRKAAAPKRVESLAEMAPNPHDYPRHD